MTGPLLLLDSATLYYRAFYALPEKMVSPAGHPHNAIRGFFSMVAKLITAHQPSGVIAAWDTDWRPDWRVNLIPSYKSHRVSLESTSDSHIELLPDTLEVQVNAIAELLDCWGIARVGIAHYEADDVIASYARQSEETSIIVTSDRDLLQCVTDRVSLLSQSTGGLEKWPLLRPADVLSRYGVDPESYVDFAVLRGDPSDGLPGIPGIGEKTASRLISEFGTLDRVIEAIGTLPYRKPLTPRIAENINSGTDYLRAALEVIRVVDDLEVDLDIIGLPRTPANTDQLIALSEYWGVQRYAVDNIQAALDGLAATES